MRAQETSHSAGSTRRTSRSNSSWSTSRTWRKIRSCSTARIADNIRMGKPDATDAEVEAAARAAGCPRIHQRACRRTTTTPAGEAGDRLSGGERQRITIARAILKDASVVILDEATAYADPENEALVERAISKLVEGKTLVTIAHRLSTITGADQIRVMDAGRIVGRGAARRAAAKLPAVRPHVARASGRGRGAHGQKRGRPGGHPPRGGEVDVRHRKTHTRRGGKLLACVATQSHCWHGVQRPERRSSWPGCLPRCGGRSRIVTIWVWTWRCSAWASCWRAWRASISSSTSWTSRWTPRGSTSSATCACAWAIG